MKLDMYTSGLQTTAPLFGPKMEILELLHPLGSLIQVM